MKVENADSFTELIKIDGIEFSDIKDGRSSNTRPLAATTISSVSPWFAGINDNSFIPSIQAVDIYWNQAKLDDDTVIESTGDLLRVIKEIRESSGELDNAKLSELEKQIDNVQRTIGSAFTNFASINYVEENYPTKTEVTQQIAEAITGGEISLEGYATEEWVKEQNYLTEHQSLENYVTSDKLEEYAKSSDLEEYAKSSDLEEYETVEGATNKYQPKGEYLTEHQSLEEYAKSSDLEEYVTSDKLEEYVKVESLDQYAKSSDVTQEIKTAIDGLVNGADETMDTLSELAQVISDNKSVIEDLKAAGLDKASKEELTNAIDGLSEVYQEKGDYATYLPYIEGRRTIQLNNYDSISGKTTTGGGVNLAMVSKWDVADFGSTQLPINLNGSKDRPTYNDDKEIALMDDIKDFVTEETVDAKFENYPTKIEVTKQITEAITGGEISLEGYATEEWVKEQNYLTEHQSLEEYAKVELLDQYVTSDKLEEYAKTTEVTKAINSKVTDLNLDQYAKSSDLEEYAKVESLDQYAKSSDLEEYETIEGAAEKYQPKGEYLTEHQSLDNYYTKEEVDSALEDIDVSDQLTNYETIEGAASKYQPKGEYLTEHQDISNLATKEEVNTAKSEAIAKVNELAGTNWAEAGQTVMDIIDELKGDNVSESMVTLVDKLKGLESDTVKEYVDEAIESATTDMATTESVTEAINSKVIDLNLAQYETVTGAAGKYQPKGEYLTEHQSLEEYAKTTEVTALLEQELAKLKAYNDYVSGCNTVTTLTEIPTSKRLVIATISESETLSLDDDIEAGRELHIVIKNNSESDITVTIDINDEDELVIDGNQIGEINIISDGTNMYVKAITK